MIISKTPYRVTFFGGGTDYPKYIKEYGGSVISAAIDKYAYISCRKLPPFFKHKHRIVYSKIEEVSSIDDIHHPAVRSVLEFLKVKDGLEIHYDGDLPARSGIGSSSSFTVGLINALLNYQNINISTQELAKKAIFVEQSIIREIVGCQDQIAAAFGGFNRINFFKNETFEVIPINIDCERKKELEGNLFIVFSGITRIASEAALAKVKNLEKSKKELNSISDFVNQAVNIIEDQSCNLSDFGELLNETWKLKKKLSDRVTNPEIDSLYSRAIEAGATGGKLLGAGGGGFFLFYVKKNNYMDFVNALSSYISVPIKFDQKGSQIILNEN